MIVILFVGCYKLVHFQGDHTHTRSQDGETSTRKFGRSRLAPQFTRAASVRICSTRVAPKDDPKHFPNKLEFHSFCNILTWELIGISPIFIPDLSKPHAWALSLESWYTNWCFGFPFSWIYVPWMLPSTNLILVLMSGGRIFTLLPNTQCDTINKD